MSSLSNPNLVQSPIQVEEFPLREVNILWCNGNYDNYSESDDGSDFEPYDNDAYMKMGNLRDEHSNPNEGCSVHRMEMNVNTAKKSIGVVLNWRQN